MNDCVRCRWRPARRTPYRCDQQGVTTFQDARELFLRGGENVRPKQPVPAYWSSACLGASASAGAFSAFTVSVRGIITPRRLANSVLSGIYWFTPSWSRLFKHRTSWRARADSNCHFRSRRPEPFPLDDAPKTKFWRPARPRTVITVLGQPAADVDRRQTAGGSGQN